MTEGVIKTYDDVTAEYTAKGNVVLLDDTGHRLVKFYPLHGVPRGTIREMLRASFDALEKGKA